MLKPVVENMAQEAHFSKNRPFKSIVDIASRQQNMQAIRKRKVRGIATIVSYIIANSFY